jgi:multimeric flavodoxin WrbA
MGQRSFVENQNNHASRAGGIVVGTPAPWGNMSTQLKCLFDRNVPVFMGEKANGIPLPRQKGKEAMKEEKATILDGTVLNDLH